MTLTPTVIKRLPILSGLATVAVSGLIYLFALLLPVYHFPNTETYIGWMVLLSGWLGPILSGTNFDSKFGLLIGWYGNLFLFAGWVALPFGKFRPVALVTFFLLLIGLGIALTSFGVRRLLTNEAGGTAPVTIGIGLYVWLASFGFALLGSVSTIALSLYAGMVKPNPKI